MAIVNDMVAWFQLSKGFGIVIQSCSFLCRWQAKLSDPYVREMIQQQISFLQGLLETDVDGGDGWDEVLCHGCSSVIQLLRRSDLLSCHQCLCQTHYHYCLAKGRDLD